MNFLVRIFIKLFNADRLNSLGVTVVIARTEFTEILSQVANWPVEDRVVLAQKILKTVGEAPQRRRRGRSADDVIRLLNIPKPTPNDDECQQILDEELFRKYGK